MSFDPGAVLHLTWPASQVAEATALLAHEAGLVSEQGPAAGFQNLPRLTGGPDNNRIELVAARLGLESEPVRVTYAEVDQVVRQAAPAIFRLPEPTRAGEAGFLFVLKQTRRGVAVIGVDSAVHYLPPKTVRSILCRPAEAPLLPAIDRMLEETGIAPERCAKVRQAILGQQLRATRLEDCWLLRLAPGAGLWRQARHTRLLRPLSLLFGAQIIHQLLLVAAWGILGRAVLQNQLAGAWLLMWGLLLLTIIPFQALASLVEGLIATKTAAIFRQKLFYGILRLDSQETRHQGAGQFLGQVLQIEALELLALNGGLTTLTAIISLITAGVVLSLGPGGWLQVGLLFGWLAVTLLIGWRYSSRYRRWSALHRQTTNELVERMVGHRTRLAQESPGDWHREEDQRLNGYLATTKKLDQTGVWLGNAIPQGWLLVGLGGLLPVIWPNSVPVTSLAIAIGGVALAFQAFNNLVSGLVSLLEAITAWEQTAPLFRAANRLEETPSPETEVVAAIDPDQERVTDARLTPLLEIDQVAFRHHQRELTLNRCTLQIYAGDRLLLEGPSGGGKSTLATILAGLRAPESGLLLWQGYDWQTLGRQTWQQQVVLAPQFHENHIITGTLAFNLLMGRRWPPTPDDIQEAETICRELGLGHLLQQMPAGMFQIVGDNGWQLSHGERSRLYLARALLQQAKLIILDESLTALDPQNLSLALICILKRAPTALVIAHP